MKPQINSLSCPAGGAGKIPYPSTITFTSSSGLLSIG